jgi:hypothetical protein
MALCQFEITQLCRRLIALALGSIEPWLQIRDRNQQIAPTQGGRLGESRVRHIRGILNPRTLLLGRNLPRKVNGQVGEVVDHCLKQGDSSRFPGSLEALQPKQRAASVHGAGPNPWSPELALLFAQEPCQSLMGTGRWTVIWRWNSWTLEREAHVNWSHRRSRILEAAEPALS